MAPPPTKPMIDGDRKKKPHVLRRRAKQRLDCFSAKQPKNKLNKGAAFSPSGVALSCIRRVSLGSYIYVFKI